VIISEIPSIVAADWAVIPQAQNAGIVHPPVPYPEVNLGKVGNADARDLRRNRRSMG
jgi:hypothetical protein